MADHTFNVTAFRLQFPQFADAAKYPDGMLSGYFAMATCYVAASDNCFIYGDCLQLALNLLTAHFAMLYTPTGGVVPGVGIITSSTIDKVTVTQQVPTTRGAWQAWLALTPYGLQLWVLLSVKSAGGWVVGGSLDRRSIRGAGGRFG